MGRTNEYSILPDLILGAINVFEKTGFYTRSDSPSSVESDPRFVRMAILFIHAFPR